MEKNRAKIRQKRIKLIRLPKLPLQTSYVKLISLLIIETYLIKKNRTEHFNIKHTHSYQIFSIIHLV